MNKDKKLIELKNLIEAAEISLQQARKILLNLVGSQEEKMLAEEAKKVGTLAASDEGQVIEGIFDGQNMVGPDGKKYSVPANYASKSKLVEGDTLKLTIQPDGSFVYKQINLLDRNRLIGELKIDETTSEYRVLAGNKSYKVLTASITYFKGEIGNKVTILIPKGKESTWAAVENIFKEGQEPEDQEEDQKIEQQPVQEDETAHKDYEQPEDSQQEQKTDEFLSQEANESDQSLIQANEEQKQKVDKPQDIYQASQPIEAKDVGQHVEPQHQPPTVQKDMSKPVGNNHLNDDLDSPNDNQGLEQI